MNKTFRLGPWRLRRHAGPIFPFVSFVFSVV